MAYSLEREPVLGDGVSAGADWRDWGPNGGRRGRRINTSRAAVCGLSWGCPVWVGGKTRSAMWGTIGAPGPPKFVLLIFLMTFIRIL